MINRNISFGVLDLDHKYILAHLILPSFCLDQEMARLASGDSLASLKRLHKEEIRLEDFQEEQQGGTCKVERGTVI